MLKPTIAQFYEQITGNTLPSHLQDIAKRLEAGESLQINISMLSGRKAFKDAIDAYYKAKR